ncbi:uncharacterized protein [Temnothorax nylanderi]|uniref:uncharacterized protein n=1 Tax=Temnothorax nylanderi TaxID=102681 RepID=UPI003A87C551
MESTKSREGRKGSNRRRGGRKEEKRELRRMKNAKSEEIASWPQFSVADIENAMGIVEQETSLDLENFDNGSERINVKPSLMCPALRRQLQTHKNVLRLLHEHKLASTQINGQRILSIQPMRWSGPTPGIECEIFVGRIPKTIYEDTLYPLFKMVGEVFQIRLMVDMAELTRGYCFIMYTNPEDAARAIAELDEYEISPGRKIRVLASVNKCKLYVGPLPWHIGSEEVVRVIYASAWDIEYVSIYRFPNHDAAYAIVSFKSHRNAALARRKLRPERLFKCNDVHVEWARVDWNPSNVYEDRGTVDDKGDVQITRKYLQSKKAASTPPAPPTQNDSNRGRKQIPPICPPNGGNGGKTDGGSFSKSINRNCNTTRYSTMLAMSSMDDSSLDGGDKKPQMVFMDINDNVQPLNGYYHFQDKTQRKKDADSFPNFDMWNSNLVPPLPNSPTSSSSPKTSDESLFLDKMANKSPRDWENGTTYPMSQPPSLNGYQYSGDSSVSNCPTHYNFLANKVADQTRPIAAVRYQNYPACYVLLQQPTYLYSKDVAYPQSSLVAHHARDGYECRSFGRNEQNGVHGSIASTDPSPVQVGEKLGDYEFWRAGVLKATGSNDATSRTIKPAASCYAAQNYSPLLLNFTPICTNAENATSCFFPLDGNDEKRPRPILKQETVCAQL